MIDLAAVVAEKMYFIKHSTRKILAICVALAVAAASALLVVGSIAGAHAQSSRASDISSVIDFYVPGSFPWGTAFDSSGRVWVAMPGCDLAPSCPSSTPPGKLALYDPNAQNWATVVSLPAGYGQPLFVAVDHTGKVWFTMPVTNSIGLYDPVSTTVAQWAVPTPGTVLGTDSFQRANQSLWGSASDGQTWGGDANNRSVFSISGNAGLVSNAGGTTYSAVLGPTASDAEVYATGSLSSFSNSNFGAVLRWTDRNNWYKAYIDGANLIIQKKVSGITTILASVPFAASAGTSYTIHFRGVGSTLTANVWAASGSEPSGWMVRASDTTFTSGFCGLRVLTQGGTATITSFLAKSL